MARDGSQFTPQQIHVFEKRTRRSIRKLRRAITADGHDAFAIDTKDRPEHPILMVADLEKLLAARSIHDAHGVISTAHRDLRSVRRKRSAENSVTSQC